MTSGFVQVPAQSKNLDTNTVTTTEGIVHRQVVNLADPTTPTSYMAVGANGAYVDVRNVVALPLPTGAATQTTLASIDAKFAALGQGAMAASVPVVIASDQSDIYVKTQSSSFANIATT